MYVESFEKLAETNTNFRTVLVTGPYSQVVAMSLPVGGDIGEETHLHIDQMFLIIEGQGEVKVGADVHSIEEDMLVFVPAGTVHNIRNTGDEDLKLLTIYAPPAHDVGVVQATKESQEEQLSEVPEGGKV